MFPHYRPGLRHRSVRALLTHTAPTLSQMGDAILLLLLVAPKQYSACPKVFPKVLRIQENIIIQF